MINNNIQEPYCSFEVSKLLSEKGFDCGNPKTAYTKDGVNKISPYSSFYDPYKYPILDCTHALAIEWIRVNFEIICTYTTPTKINNKWLFGGKIFSMKNEGDNIVIGAFNSPQEAIEEALLYTLKNLIK